MVLETSLLNTQHYKVWIKGKVEQSSKRGSTLPNTSVQQLLKKKPLGHPPLWSQIYFLYIYIHTKAIYRILQKVSVDKHVALPANLILASLAAQVSDKRSVFGIDCFCNKLFPSGLVWFVGFYGISTYFLLRYTG